MTNLVIVESQGKVKSIQSYLGGDYIVKSCFGHIRDLNKDNLSIDISNNFNPIYSIINDKKKLVNELVKIKNKVSNVILATDNDREGEAIADGLREVLKLNNPDRIVFVEITKDAILNAIKNKRKIDENLVMAQTARRVLDRLVGYKISPILWKIMKGQLSAGRVQSIAVKIIIDKENEINSFDITNSFYKTSIEFNYNDIILKAVLVNNDTFSVYHIDYNNINIFLKNFNKNTNYKIIDIIKKEYNKSPPKPFITSSLQQEAYTQLGFTAKRTMSTAQKLYEAKYITYMRTDSYNMSKVILNQCKQYIIKNYTESYYQYREFKSKVKNAQEAHECIRPTDINNINISNLNEDCIKLYDLIWKRTIATQMKDCIMNSNTILIDSFNKNISILPDNTIFMTTLENIKFNGYLIIYNKDNEDNISINKDSLLEFKEFKIIQEYKQPPLRYNEAGLIKCLEKNGIGRPATFASIISKIIERQYVIIKNVDGIEMDSIQYKVNKNYKIKEEIKKVKVGKENKKLVPTELGINVTKFLTENFPNIMDIEYTAKFEKLLDRIARGKVKYHNVMEEYYNDFNPIVEKLLLQLPELEKSNKNDIYLGKYNNNDIYTTIGKYGLCIKMIIINDDKETYKFFKVRDDNTKQTDIDINKAIEIIEKESEYPKFIGKIGKSKVDLCKGQYGFYYKMGNITKSVKEEDISYNIEDIKILFENNNILKTFKVDKTMVYLKKGPYGYYLNYKKNGKNINKSLPDNIDIEKFKITKL